jgi:hypothetical protein
VTTNPFDRLENTPLGDGMGTKIRRTALQLRTEAKQNLQDEDKKERSSMAEANDPGKKTAMKAATGKEAVTLKTEQTKSDSSQMKPAAEKAEALAKKAASKAAAGKEVVAVKTDPTKSDSSKMKPAAKKANAPAKQTAGKAAAGQKVAAVKTERTKSDTATKKPIAEKARTAVKKPGLKTEKTKGAFAKKAEKVKSSAAGSGKKTADIAKDINEKSDTLEDRIASSLHEVKKVIHWAAVSIAGKTKEE